MQSTKLYVCVAILSARVNQKLLKLHSKGFERSVYWNEYETESENKNATNEYRHFLELNFVGVNRLFVLVYSNQGGNAKRFKTWRYYLPKGIIKNYVIIINGNNFYDQASHSDIKWYEEIRKLTAGKSEDYTTGCFLDYDYIKSHYRLIAFDLSRQKRLDADPKTIQQTEFFEQSKNIHDINGDGTQNIVIFNSFWKHQRNEIKILSRICSSIINNDKLSGSKC